jgi:multidrug resistance efflux pump
MASTENAMTPSVKKPLLSPETSRRLKIFGGIGIVVLIAGAVGVYLILSSARVYIDTATITAPLISLTPTTAGQLNAVYVNEGDVLLPNTPVALVGTELITAKDGGLVVKVNDIVGAQVAPGDAVVTMIDPTALRVVGQIDEDKGLSKIQVGDPVVFTVDAFGSQKFNGVIDEVAPTSNESDIVFSVSDQREEQTFDVKARFDTSTYPQLKNGMSARMWVYQ